jgi:SPP1 gp7 family putative phage head morphogenesis protein
MIARQRFLRSRIAERAFRSSLIKVARNVGAVIQTFAPEGKVTNMGALQSSLNDYARILRPWANSVVVRMHDEVGQRDAKAWFDLADEMGRRVKDEINNAPVGMFLSKYLSLQVDLITSLPREASDRVHMLTIEGLSSGRRSDEIAQDIMRSGIVTVGRAKMIARTETARTASVMNQIRAQAVGSKGYFWRTMKDADVRSDHRHLEGVFVPWNEPPIAGLGAGGIPMRYHAGQGPNCRCFGESVLPDLA